jgi:uncharacterized protein
MGQFIRLLIIALVIWLAVRLLRRFLAAQRSGATPAYPPRMLPCAHCGVYVPESGAIRHGERAYCCEEHRQIGLR